VRSGPNRHQARPGTGIVVLSISAGYQTRTEVVPLPGGDLHIRGLLDRQQFHDPSGEAEAAGISSAAWPLFGLIWPSGRMLAAHMQTFDIAGKQVLEVGCGLALASLVVHRRQGNITASDCHPLTAEFLRHNLINNCLLPMAYTCGNWAVENAALGRFDLIVGSDVLYDRNQPALLSGFIARHACATAEVLIVDPDRGNRPSFNRHMSAAGYRCEETRLHELPQQGGHYKGRLLHYRRGNADSGP
ncbi:MAG: hypothetical protein Q8J78_16990, partial [Moraxellaceae bacterium]|nr:hypothetical protein [Moraxellaceae bacterium]